MSAPFPHLAPYGPAMRIVGAEAAKVRADFEADFRTTRETMRAPQRGDAAQSDGTVTKVTKWPRSWSLLKAARGAAQHGARVFNFRSSLQSLTSHLLSHLVFSQRAKGLIEESDGSDEYSAKPPTHMRARA